MIMNNKMIKFDVKMYNEKIAKLNELIDLFDEIDDLFRAWGQKMTPDVFKSLMDRPAKIFHKHLSIKRVSKYEYNIYGVDKDECNTPNSKECEMMITFEMNLIQQARYKFYALLSYIKEAYNSSLFSIKEGDNFTKAKIVKTKNAELKIMQQCAVFENKDYINEEV